MLRRRHFQEERAEHHVTQQEVSNHESIGTRIVRANLEGSKQCFRKAIDDESRAFARQCYHASSTITNYLQAICCLVEQYTCSIKSLERIKQRVDYRFSYYSLPTQFLSNKKNLFVFVLVTFLIFVLVIFLHFLRMFLLKMIATLRQFLSVTN